MAVITFWNNKNGHVGQTSSILATATQMAIEHNYKILLISTKIDDIECERAFGIAENIAARVLGMRESRFNSGIEGIMKLASSNKLEAEMIGNYTKIVLKNRLEVIGGKKIEEMSESDKFDVNLYPNIAKIADKYYDMVFVDLDNGFDEEYKKKMLNITDIVVWNFEQKFHQIDEILEYQAKNNVTDKKKIVYLYNKYEKNSKYNLKNTERNSKVKKDLYAVPYDVMFSDSMQDGTLDGWLLNPKIRKAKPLDDHGSFINEVNQLCQGIIDKLHELHVIR